ncbi:uncharacterized protein LOC110713305 [Chenopodium quinoa]|uniref:uncharacterized protein LOC110713305 n=1 Tax=Chenopodium quinoa TaxID=63459 RepID=UPI000B76C3AF|nr:uncharacterized protein LOC110713305 [Chenopodium quinoa]
MVQQDQHFSSKWVAPAAGLYKLNTDVAFHEQLLGIGGIVRDAEGDVLVAFCSTEKGCVSVDVGEAITMRGSLRIAMEAGFQKFILEIDNLKLFYHMKKGITSPCAFGGVVRDILQLARGCQSVSYPFVRRTDNSVAHNLAQLSFNFSEYRVWLEVCPSEIQGIVCNDLDSS